MIRLSSAELVSLTSHRVYQKFICKVKARAILDKNQDSAGNRTRSAGVQQPVEENSDVANTSLDDVPGATDNSGGRFGSGENGVHHEDGDQPENYVLDRRCLHDNVLSQIMQRHMSLLLQ